MKTQIRKTAPLGELISAVFDKAAQYSSNPHEISRLATQAVSHLLWHAPGLKISRSTLRTVS